MLKQLILYTLVILITFACGSPENDKNKNSSSEKADLPIIQDTIDSMLVPPPPPEPGLPPGTARITGRILSVTDSTMTVKVTTANEYGSSTPAVAGGSTLTILIPDFLAKNIKELKEGKKIVCLINYRQFLALDKNSNNNSHWVLKGVSSSEGPQ